MRDLQVRNRAAQQDWNPVRHGGFIVGSAIILFIIVVWAAVRWPLNWAAVESVFGFLLVSIVGFGIGTLATGAVVELEDRKKDRDKQWSPFGATYLRFIVIAFAAVAGGQGFFLWFLFDSQAGGASRWIFWVFLAGTLGSGALGWYFIAPKDSGLAKATHIPTQGKWPSWPGGRNPAQKPQPPVEHAGDPADGGAVAGPDGQPGTIGDAQRLVRAFIPLAILIGMIGGATGAVSYIGGSAYLENSDVPSAPGMPAYLANIQGSYVALGDSYSAGEGLRPFVTGTNTPTDDCHRAGDTAGDPATGLNPAYPTLLEGWLPSADRASFIFHACSGALINEVLNQTDRDVLRIPAQYAGGKDPSVGLVTLTIGGNNAVFSQIVTSCLLSNRCMDATFPPPWVSPAQGSQVKPGPLYSTWAPQTIEEIGRQDFTLFTQLRTDFPNARIIVVGYPYLFPADKAPGPPYFPPLCSALLNRFTSTERTQLRTLQDDLTYRTYEEAVAAGVEFVSPDAIWGDHVPCGQDQQYTNSVKPFLSYSTFFNFSAAIDTGSFHPNAAGQRVYGSLLACYLDANPGPSPTAAPDPYLQGAPHSVVIPAASLVLPRDLGLVDPPGKDTVPGSANISGC
jgi:hypothetical protein